MHPRRARRGSPEPERPALAAALDALTEAEIAALVKMDSGRGEFGRAGRTKRRTARW